jgi:8-oxo-dGTP pyrophosphatase MutT (NUDIX family)
MDFEDFGDRIKRLGVLYVDVYPYHLDDDGRPSFLILKRRSDVVLADSWQFISGKLMKGETIRKAFIRQVVQKTSQHPIKMFKIERVNIFYDDYYDTVMVVPAACCQLVDKRVLLDETLHTEFAWITAREADEFLQLPVQIEFVRAVEAHLLGRGFTRFQELSVD